MKPITKGCLSAAILTSLAACGGGGPVPGDTTSSSVISSQPSSSNTVSSTPASSTPTGSSSSAQTNPGVEKLVYAMNVGGNEATYDGITFERDTHGYASGGSPNRTDDLVSGISNEMLQSELFGEFTIEVGVTEGTYKVDLYFVEMYNTASGTRSFNLSIEGDEKMSDFDLYSQIGHDEMYMHTVSDIRVTDGKFTLELENIPNADNATLSGFALYSADGELIPPPPPPPPPPPSPEHPGTDCDVGSLPDAGSLPASKNLPDPFTKLDGTRMTTKEEWHCRREEILQQSFKYLYGVKPDKPDNVSGTVSNSRVTVNVSHEGRSASFSASVSLPSGGSAPYPAIITMSASGGATEAQRLGVAVINLNPYDVAPEGSPRGTRGAFYSVYPGSRAGLLAAWSWGASRIIDVLEDDPSLLDPNYMAVTGCSRFGKAAFTAGALDARIKLTMPIESGVGGTSALKLIFPTNGGEKPYHAISYEHWFSPTALGPFASSNNDSSGPDRLPVDIHEVMGLVAPRGLYIVANPSSNYAGLNAAATNATAKVGKEIYKALGYEENLTFVGASGGHCQWRSGYTAQLRENVNKFLKPNGSGNTGVFTTDRADTDPSQWVNWTTPNLSGNLQ